MFTGHLYTPYCILYSSCPFRYPSNYISHPLPIFPPLNSLCIIVLFPFVKVRGGRDRTPPDPSGPIPGDQRFACHTDQDLLSLVDPLFLLRTLSLSLSLSVSLSCLLNFCCLFFGWCSRSFRLPSPGLFFLSMSLHFSFFIIIYPFYSYYYFLSDFFLIDFLFLFFFSSMMNVCPSPSPFIRDYYILYSVMISTM